MTGAQFKRWREMRGLSQADLARRLPVSVRTLQEWESVSRATAPPAYIDRALRDLDREMREERGEESA